MNALIIADDESVLNRIPEQKVDLLLSCGDLPDEVISRVAGRCSCRSILAVKGNHDSSGAFPSSVIDLHLKIFSFDGLLFGGFCGSWKYKPRGNYLFEQSEVESALASFPRVDVFVAHNSPHLVHDKDDEVHAGFTAFSSYINRCKPRFFFHGHQHVNQESVIGVTRVIGTYGHRYFVIPEPPTHA